MRRSLNARLSVPAQRFGAMPLGSKVALAFFGLVVLLAVLAPVIAPFDPLKSGIPALPPSFEHLFGTDRNGRDIFSRLLYGARFSLAIGLGATSLALIAGAIIGSIAATASKWLSETIMRILDIIMSFPGIALAIVFVAVFGKELPILICTIAFLYVPQIARIVRANVMAQFGEDYVSAERVMGARLPHILFWHVARNCAAPIMVFVTVLVADAIVFEASLSFIGAGVQDPAPSWGNVISSGRNLLLSGGWWATFFPGMLILITVLSLNILAEGLTDALVKPAAKNAKAVAAVSAADSATTTTVSVVETAAASVPLEMHLAQLRLIESTRTDRLVYTGDAAPLLEVKNLSIRFPNRHGDIAIVDNVSFSVRPSETMALVGESGCGKSITSLAIMGLLPDTAEITGQILFEGRDLLTMPRKERQALLGHEMAMVYQDALSSLNPSMLVSTQLGQLIKRGGTRSATELLELVGLDPVRTLKSYPHELSGGQRQRVLIAMALTRDPKLIVADEPTTALDVTVQAQVIDLLNDLREKLGFAMVFVSHDLALVAELAHRITVMYAGQVVESAPTTALLMSPRHEYTRGLLGSVLSIEDGATRLHQIPGTVPSPRDFATGDRFAPRSRSGDAIRATRPELRPITGTLHLVSTHNDALLAPDDELETTR
ncbi:MULTISPECIES: dipeptide/oligopeptide/nickel ABC transporter permease/ATP-binding protein [Cryobacterium]|uniref:ABC transporter n=1 Tax=Cryobacterium zongtaii TaxID=1259217 RepID=A0A2S3ZGB7_9MICO|nr:MULTISPECIES: dipeptide/oligopeptide/nickel ABC transporter permease/ATP-binding protein [Cryobacterium]MEC5185871.1 peptide/nickel transport system permease protein [Cryobacterium sp. MP_3.1]POH63703.1 ABC transporter [Cryobacterium zongtaii]POH66430.1 ABC transporter [Cryobacterium zongtaii]TFC40835.1 dipeptide/oligopeptide/nickel ABC transporter permease/ATP-binding protein [Cryobacterium sp. TMN-39-2]